jgi:hypothetical protein
MPLLSLLLLLLGTPGSHAYNSNHQLGQMSVVRQLMANGVSNRREPMRMPSETPMVPYKVVRALCVVYRIVYCNPS